MNKGKLYAYTIYSQNGEKFYKTQDFFIYKNEDRNFWNLNYSNFQLITDFIIKIFK